MDTVSSYYAEYWISIFCYVFFFSLSTSAQYKEEVNLNDYYSDYDQVLVTIYLDGGYSFDSYVVIQQPDILYLDVEAVFKPLQIKCIPKLNNLVGFIENEKNLYTINFEKKQITIGGKSINISRGIIEELGVKYIRASLLFEAFGLKFIFNPRSLTAKLTSDFDTPFILQQKRMKTREKISELRGEEIIVDTIITRDYHLLKLGTLNWGLSSSQSKKNKSNTDIKIELGTELLFGEANFLIDYNTKNKFNITDIRTRWRFINNDNKFIKQAIIGRVPGERDLITDRNTTAIGATINNTPNTVRKATGSYTITNTTEPNWNVELYLNDVLIDYTQADAAGLYVFKVPILFGVTNLTLRFYGPLGEVRTEQKTVNNPYTVVPVKKLEYSLTAGVIQDSINNPFGNLTLNYGVTSNLTVAGGVAYSPNNTAHPINATASASFQPFSVMFLNLDYIHEQRIKGILDYYITKNAFLNIGYTQFIEGKLPGASRLLKKIEVNFSKPYKNKFFSGLSQISFIQSRFKTFNYNAFNLMLNSTVNKVKVNSSFFINWASATTPQINSRLALSYKLENGLALQSLASYDLTTNNFKSIGLRLQKKISKINLICSLQRSVSSKTTTLSFSANYALPFSNVAFSSFYNGNNFNFAENATGSMAFGAEQTPHVGNNSAIGKGGFLLYPFLDLNGNGKLDKGEKKVFLPSVKVSGAKAIISKKDSIVRVFDLNAFRNYNVEFLDTDLNNIAWRFKHKTYKIFVDPNQYKRVFIPVISVGEINGMVYLGSRGQGRITIQVLDEKENIVVETLSEFDGYFNYLGLKPGKYTVRVDPEQIKNLNFKALPKVHQVTIKVSEYGDIIDDLDFTLSKKVPKKPKE
tara:strand:- start:2030 stop:4624 length:2595 start_codon:yes stop_codon:yes gene_type:complete